MPRLNPLYFTGNLKKDFQSFIELKRNIAAEVINTLYDGQSKEPYVVTLAWVESQKGSRISAGSLVPQSLTREHCL